MFEERLSGADFLGREGEGGDLHHFLVCAFSLQFSWQEFQSTSLGANYHLEWHLKPLPLPSPPSILSQMHRVWSTAEKLETKIPYQILPENGIAGFRAREH